MSTQLTFQNVALTVIDLNNRIFVSAGDLARALLYKDASAVNRIYSRHEDEFSPDMTSSVNLTDPKNPQYDQRIFSLRGAHLIAMFARTPVAKQFRKWVLDILDRETQQPKQLALPEPEPEQSVIVDITAGEVHSLVWLLLSHRNMNALLGELEKPLRAIGSNFAPTVYSHHHEYKYLIKTCNPLLKRLIEPFKKTNRMEYERIKHRLDLEPEKLLNR